MPYRIGWFVPDRIVVVQSIDDLTLDEIAEACAITTRLINSGTAPVHCISDTRLAKSVPSYLIKLQQTSSQVMQNHKLGWFLVLTNNRVFSALASMISSIFRVKYTASAQTHTLLAGLEKSDPTLPPLPVKIQIVEEVHSVITR